MQRKRNDYIIVYLFISLWGILSIGCNNKTKQEIFLSIIDTPIAPLTSTQLNPWLDENSGIILWNDTVLLQNDSSEPVLYGIDTSSGAIISKMKFPGLQMQDWESITQDEEYIYIGDFGNNFNYRKNLRIFKVEIKSLGGQNVKIDTINFHYEDQVDYSYIETLDTDYDCESMIVVSDSIYLFTKQWINKGTSVYAVPVTPGEYSASKISDYQIEGLITDAFKFPDENTIILTGYSKLMAPFFVILEEYHGNHFFSGKVKKINVDLLFSQIEAICQKEGYKCYVTREGFFKLEPELYVFDFTSYINAIKLLKE